MAFLTDIYNNEQSCALHSFENIVIEKMKIHSFTTSPSSFYTISKNDIFLP